MVATSKKRESLWRADSFVGVLVVLAVLVLYFATDFVGTLERRFYDFSSTTTSRQPSDQIAIIAIDDQSIANIGRWPWSREVHAKLIDQLAAARAKTIAHTAFFFEPQTDRGMAYIQQIKTALAAMPPADPAAPDSNEPLRQLVAQAELALNTDAQLAASMARAGNVILPSYFSLGEPPGRADTPLPAFALQSAVDENQGFSEPSIRGQHPIELIGKAAAGIGHLNQDVDPDDGAVRREPLLVNYYGKAVPSLALLASMKSLNLGVQDIRLDAEGAVVQVGQLKIKTDAEARMLPQFYTGREGKPAFAVDSFFDVLTGKIPAAKYAGKIVLIGPTATGLGVQFAAPGHAALTPVETVAHITSSILNQHFIVEPEWAPLASVGAFLLVAGYLIAWLPRLSAAQGATITAVLFLMLMVSEFGLLSSAATWVKLVPAATLLLIGHLALTTKRFLVTEAGKAKSDEESAETNRMMGLALQGQGQLDMAFDRFSRVPLDDAVMGNLYNLAQDFERKRQFNKAQAVYEHMATYNKGYKDLETKRTRAQKLSETVMLGGGSTHPGGTLLLEGGGVEKPMLGRYQVEKELGKGAMGVVYLGRDPKIGRVVAIKTMALSQEFEGEELVDARERFFREAETAGRLQHQHIVTIFDAGEEHDLAFIAMEFLKGKDLADFGRSDNLLPAPTVVSIVARVAQALAYAHRNGVVHRDIKPANIMYDLASDTVKVTDFGIARITDSSKTKTGMVLGTPSFMSPEQIAGKRVDGRSDLYSLGVMLYQMLAGVLPFRGESMAELMYKIANEDPPDLQLLRPELPRNLCDVVTLSLAKRPEIRYQDGDQFAADLMAALNTATSSLPVSLEPNMPLASANTAQAAMKTVASSVYQQKPLGAPPGALSAPGAPAADTFEKTQVVHQGPGDAPK